jgi:hypothetical protein
MQCKKCHVLELNNSLGSSSAPNNEPTQFDQHYYFLEVHFVVIIVYLLSYTFQ